ncbi:MAG TPA: CotH kinase family protein [Kofleriaceae bacterium]|nr:CotH kinase family protein [Kofleriaceae bacterium]
MSPRARLAIPGLAISLVLSACSGNAPVGDDDDVGADGGTPDSRTDGPRPDAVIPTVPPDVDGRIVINEFMASNALTTKDENGLASDWIELYNPTSQDLSLHGYSITNNLAEPGLHHFDGVIISAHGHIILWADERPPLGGFHLGFKLDADGGEIGLARPDGTYIDRVHYGAQETDFSSARQPDASSGWTTVWKVTPAAANAAGNGQPMGLEQPSSPPEEIAAMGDLTEQILGYDRMPAMELLVSAANVAALEAEPFVDVPAQIVFQGRTYGPVGLRLKGQNSFQTFSRKPSLRINVDEFEDKAKFWGLKDLTLNNMSLDPSQMHERLAYWVMRNAGMPASRANHLVLTVNGQLYGLYANVETVKKQMVARWFADNTGPLFEGTDVDFAAQYIDRYELESGPNDRSMLSGAATALTMSGDAAIAAAANYVDMARFQKFWAVCSVIGQFDSFPYSLPGDDYFAYADPTSDRLVFMPWGMDETFFSGNTDVTQTSSILAQRCKESPSCFDAYKAETMAIQGMTETMGLAAERTRVAAQIAPFTVMDTRKPWTNEQVTAAQDAMRWFISGRRNHLNTMLAPPTP